MSTCNAKGAEGAKGTARGVGLVPTPIQLACNVKVILGQHS